MIEIKTLNLLHRFMSISMNTKDRPQIQNLAKELLRTCQNAADFDKRCYYQGRTGGPARRVGAGREYHHSVEHPLHQRCLGATRRRRLSHPLGDTFRTAFPRGLIASIMAWGHFRRADRTILADNFGENDSSKPK